MQEKRRCHRLNIQLPASFQSPTDAKSFSLATTIDISATGICFSSREPLQIGKELPVQVRLPNNEKLIINVTVIWVKEIQVLTSAEFRIGVRISDARQADEVKFVKFYARKLKELESTIQQQ